MTTRRGYLSKKKVTVTVDLPMPLRYVDELPSQLFKVALLIADGWRNEAIARKLRISIGTVRIYVSDIYFALGYTATDRQKDSRVCVAQQVWIELADTESSLRRRQEFGLLVEEFTSKLKNRIKEKVA